MLYKFCRNIIHALNNLKNIKKFIFDFIRQSHEKLIKFRCSYEYSKIGERLCSLIHATKIIN